MLRRKADIKQNPQLYVYGFCFLRIPSLQKKNALPKQSSIQALCRFLEFLVSLCMWYVILYEINYNRAPIKTIKINTFRKEAQKI